MKDILTFSAVLIGSYTAFMAVLILFGRMFFPFYTKEQLEKRNALTKKHVDRRREIGRKAIAQLNLKSNISLDRTVYSKFVRG